MVVFVEVTTAVVAIVDVAVVILQSLIFLAWLHVIALDCTSMSLTGEYLGLGHNDLLDSAEVLSLIARFACEANDNATADTSGKRTHCPAAQESTAVT